jgi:hypothetical protein
VAEPDTFGEFGDGTMCSTLPRVHHAARQDPNVRFGGGAAQGFFVAPTQERQAEATRNETQTLSQGEERS